MSRKKFGNGHKDVCDSHSNGHSNGNSHRIDFIDEAPKFDYKANFSVKLKTKTQRTAYSLFKDVDFLFLIGPAGVGKSFVATALGVRETVECRARRLILTRPIKEAEESLGFLPGTFEEKMAPYLEPLNDQLFEVFSDANLRKQYEQDFINVAPLAYMRGRTFSNSVCILDEAQNCSYKQLKLFLTRLGHNGKMIITGDPDQTDINNSGLIDVIERCHKLSSVGVVEFSPSDNVRNPSVEEILSVL